MKRKRHSEEEIIKKLRGAQTMQAGGASVETVKRLKELERENARLKKLVAEQSLDMAILKEVAEGK